MHIYARPLCWDIRCRHPQFVAFLGAKHVSDIVGRVADVHAVTPRPIFFSSYWHQPHPRLTAHNAYPRSVQSHSPRQSFADTPLPGVGGYGDDPVSDPEDSSSRIQSSLYATRPTIFSKPGTDVRAFTATLTQLCFPRCSLSLPFWPGRPPEPTRFCLFRKSALFHFPFRRFPDPFRHLFSPDVTRTSASSTSSRPAVIIRRHAPVKPHPRARLLDDPPELDPSSPSQSPTPLQPQDISTPLASDTDDALDELTCIRQFLRPPPIPGLHDWGIPPEPTKPCDPAIRVCALPIPFFTQI